MKLLIACDNTTDMQPMLADLKRAGLPPTAQTIVLSVVDLLPLPSPPPGSPPSAANQRARERIARAVDEVRHTADAAAAQTRAAFPGWSVTAEARADAPAWAIVSTADEWLPDLIIVGSHDRSPLGQFLLGSVSQTVLTHAGCSVRIVRGSAAAPDTPQRLLVGVDGSAGAAAAIDRVASRSWQPGTQVRVVMALDATLASMLDPADADRLVAGRLVEGAAATLRAAGLEVSTAVVDGPAKRVLVEDAQHWTAECIFVGARGLRATERFLLGSVSTAVAARAHCTVEVVRR
jgi:nucleotide-binding universal stress UspA family protein